MLQTIQTAMQEKQNIDSEITQSVVKLSKLIAKVRDSEQKLYSKNLMSFLGKNNPQFLQLVTGSKKYNLLRSGTAAFGMKKFDLIIRDATQEIQKEMKGLIFLSFLITFFIQDMTLQEAFTRRFNITDQNAYRKIMQKINRQLYADKSVDEMEGIVENKFKSVVNPEKNDLYEFVDLFYSLSRPNDFNGQKMSGEDTMVLQTLKEENSFYTPGLHSLRHLYGSLKDEINRDWNKVISF